MVLTANGLYLMKVEDMQIYQFLILNCNMGKIELLELIQKINTNKNKFKTDSM